MDEIVKYQWQNEEIVLNKNDVKNLISTSVNVTDKEIQLFMMLCKYQQLNPFIREAYLIKYGTSPAQFVTGVEVFTKRAEGCKEFDGVIRSNNYDEADSRNKWWSQVDVYRKNLKEPITTRVYYEEYVGTDKNGNVTKMWRNKARTMLDKVALMQGLRLAFPTALGGLYEEHELDQQEAPKKGTSLGIDPDSEDEKHEEDKEEDKVVEVETEEAEEKMMDDKQEMYIKAMLLNNILTENEKKGVIKARTAGITYKLAEEIIERYKEVKDMRTHDYVSLILAKKRELFVPATLIKKWAGVDKLDDLHGVAVNVLEDVLEKTKTYHK